MIDLPEQPAAEPEPAAVNTGLGGAALMEANWPSLPNKPRRPVRRREDLTPMLRAVSDTLDHHNHHMHGITSSWAHPTEFLEVLGEYGHTVVATEELEAERRKLHLALREVALFREITQLEDLAQVVEKEVAPLRAAIARVRRLAERWSAWTPQDGDRGTLSTAGRALVTALDPPLPGEFSVQVMTSWSPYAPEIVAEMTGQDEAELRRTYGDTINVRMGLGGPVELRWGGPGPDPADVEETRSIVRDHMLWADRARGPARTIPSLTLSQPGLTPTLRPTDGTTL